MPNLYVPDPHVDRDWLRRARAAAGFQSDRALAAAIGVRPPRLCIILSGRVRVTRPTADRIAHKLRVPTDDLIEALGGLSPWSERVFLLQQAGAAP